MKAPDPTSLVLTEGGLIVLPQTPPARLPVHDTTRLSGERVPGLRLLYLFNPIERAIRAASREAHWRSASRSA